jgi:predicted component of type VI protein secretion system
MNSSYQLVIRSGPAVGTIFPVDKPELVIGREQNADITVNDPEVSRKHARIFLQGQNCFIEDLGSTNGTTINGQRIEGPYMLQGGETISFGEHVSLGFVAARVDLDSTVASSGLRGSPTYKAPQTGTYQTSLPPQTPPQYNPPPSYQPPAPSFSGQVPVSPEFDEPEERKKFPTWLIVVLVGLLLLICVCVVSLIIIDTSNMWCDLFGWFFGPNACPSS